MCQRRGAEGLGFSSTEFPRGTGGGQVSGVRGLAPICGLGGYLDGPGEDQSWKMETGDREAHEVACTAQVRGDPRPGLQY